MSHKPGVVKTGISRIFYLFLFFFFFFFFLRQGTPGKGGCINFEMGGCEHLFSVKSVERILLMLLIEREGRTGAGIFR